MKKSLSIGILSHWIDIKNIVSLRQSIGILSHWIVIKNIVPLIDKRFGWRWRQNHFNV